MGDNRTIIDSFRCESTKITATCEHEELKFLAYKNIEIRVPEGFEGMGIGSYIFSTIIFWAQQYHPKAIVLPIWSNTEASPFYKKFNLPISGEMHKKVSDLKFYYKTKKNSDGTKTINLVESVNLSNYLTFTLLQIRTLSNENLLQIIKDIINEWWFRLLSKIFG